MVSLLKSTNYDLGIASAKTIAAIYDGIDTKAKHFVHRNLLQIIDDISTMRSHVYSFKYVSKRKDVVLFYLKVSDGKSMLRWPTAHRFLKFSCKSFCKLGALSDVGISTCDVIILRWNSHET